MRKLKTRRRNYLSSGIHSKDSVTGPGTIISAMETIVVASGDSELSDEMFAEAKPAFDTLKERLSITDMQAIVISMLIDSDCTLSTGRMANYLGLRNIRMLTYVPEIEELVERRILCKVAGSFENGYKISPKALAAYMRDKEYVHVVNKNISAREMIDTAMDIMGSFKSEEITLEQMQQDIEELVKSNKNIVLGKKAAKVGTDEKILFFFCLGRYVNEGDRNIVDHDYRELYDERTFGGFQSSIINRSNALFSQGLLGDGEGGGISPRDSITVSDEIQEYINRELNICWDSNNENYRKGLLIHEDIVAKELFYNGEERISIERLATMLKDENFKEIQQRMRENGMRNGFACLFYGAPGTGKTETALQLARTTGRDIMQVNIAGIRSKWVGESEKNIRGIFNRYRACCEKSEKKPILLFNEADAVIGKRTTNVERSVDKMENSLQNIILEEIEKLDGILIATTNLTSNMDTAFERRFIYKVEFHRPDIETKKLIWQSMISELDDNDAATLAGEFDLSGGQIENVKRKQVVDNILYGTAPTLESLRGYCTQEGIGTKGSNRPHIGF